jgi:hypothetical protein
MSVALYPGDVVALDAAPDDHLRVVALGYVWSPLGLGCVIDGTVKVERISAPGKLHRIPADPLRLVSRGPNAPASTVHPIASSPPPEGATVLLWCAVARGWFTGRRYQSDPLGLARLDGHNAAEMRVTHWSPLPDAPPERLS